MAREVGVHMKAGSVVFVSVDREAEPISYPLFNLYPVKLADGSVATYNNIVGNGSFPVFIDIRGGQMHYVPISSSTPGKIGSSRPVTISFGDIELQAESEDSQLYLFEC